METLGDLSLAADVDPDGAAAQLNASRAAQDLDAMLSLLRAEERRNSRAEHSRSSGRVVDSAGNAAGGDGGGGGGGGGGDLLAAPCLEFLLEERVVKLLCEMGSADRPAGTMALVLGAIASLLGQVRDAEDILYIYESWSVLEPVLARSLARCSVASLSMPRSQMTTTTNRPFIFMPVQ